MVQKFNKTEKRILIWVGVALAAVALIAAAVVLAVTIDNANNAYRDGYCSVVGCD